MLSNNNLSFCNATKYSNEIIIIESSQEFSRDLEYTCYHQIYFDISQFIFFPTSRQMFFSSFFQINSREQMRSRSIINHDPKIHATLYYLQQVISLYIFVRTNSERSSALVIFYNLYNLGEN